MRAPGALDFFTYVALPFKLLAGPLEPPSFIRQLQQWQPRFSLVRVTAAWPWLALGTVMKFVIGNRLTPAVTLGDTHPTVALLTAAIFELKFCFDFAGYSFIGYGGALLFGFRISRNFTHPFLASNVVLFWRRWHMSLGRFLARYLLMTLVRCSRWARSSSANASRRRGMVRSVPCRVPCSSRVTGVFC